jgi:membrane-associated phospholipid phosphatase
MRFRTALLASAFLLGTVQAASAQSVGRMVVDDFKYAGQDMWAVWTAPFDGSGQDWLLAAGLIAGSHVLMPIDDDVDRWAVRDSASALFKALKPFRRHGVLFQGHRLVPVAGAALIAGYAFKNQDIRDGMYGCATSWLSNNMIRHQVLYRFVRRERPNPHKDGPATPPAAEGDQYDFGLSAGDTSWGHNSWPGGHVANVAACASFFRHRFEMGYAEPVLWALVAGVGVGRLADRAHWTSDQVLGVVFGYAIGREVALRQRKREERRRAAEGSSAAPAIPTSPRDGLYLVNDPQRGIGLGWQRAF